MRRARGERPQAGARKNGSIAGAGFRLDPKDGRVVPLDFRLDLKDGSFGLPDFLLGGGLGATDRLCFPGSFLRATTVRKDFRPEPRPVPKS